MVRTFAARVALAVLALVGVSIAPTPALAACPYSGNTIGPPYLDSGATLAALNDICANTDGLEGQGEAATTGGATPYHLLSAANTNPTLISAGAHTLYTISAINTTGTIYYLKFYDKVSAPSTCATDSALVKLNYPIPASASGAGFSVNLGTFGAAFESGLAFCLTGGQADNDTTNAATGINLNVTYK